MCNEREQSVLVPEFVNPLQLGHESLQTKRLLVTYLAPHTDQALANPPL